MKLSKSNLLKPNIEKMEAKRDVNGLIKSLKNENVNFRINGALALGKIKRARAVAPLIEALHDEDEDVRWAAAWSLGEIGKPAARPLIQVLNDEDSDVRWKAAWALEKIGKPVVESLIQALKVEKGEAKAKVAVVLGSIGDIRAIRPLVQALSDEDENVRWGATWALEKIGGAATNALSRALASEDRDTRRDAAIALGIIKDETAIDPLLAAMRDEDLSVRGAAASALANIGGRKAISTLQLYLREDDEDLRRSSAEVLGKLGWQPDKETDRLDFYIANRQWADAVKLAGDSLPMLLKALKEESWEVRRQVALALKERGREAIDLLVEALEDSDEDIRREAALIFKEVGDETTIEPLVRALSSSDWFVRRNSALTLGELGNQKAIQPLIGALKDRDEDVRRVAAWALGRLGEMAVDPLLEALREGDTDVRKGAAWALGVIGDTQAAGALIGALKDPDEEVRRGAAWALGEMGTAVVPQLNEAMGDEELRPVVAEILEKAGVEEERVLAGGDFFEEEVPLAGEEIIEAALEPLEPSFESEPEQPMGAASQVLDKLGWKAEGEIDKLGSLISKGRWDEVTELGDEAVDRLIEVLQSGNPEVRSRAAWSLGVIGSGRSVQPLVQALTDPDADVRSKVAGALKKMPASSLDPLIDALRDPSPDLRREAAQVLGEIKDIRAITPLIKSLDDGDERVRAGAAGALEKIGSPAIESLQEALQDEDRAMRVRAGEILKKLGWETPTETDEIEALISQGQWEQVAAMGELAMDRLLVALGDESPDRRRGAAWALGVIRNPKAVPPLIGALEDPDTSVRRGAAWALGVIGNRGATEALTRSLRDEDAEMRRKVAWALGEIADDAAVESLVGALNDADEDVRRVVLLVLEKLGWKPPEEAEEVQQLVADREWDRLAGMGDVAVGSLIEALESGDEEMRVKAAWALGEIGDARAVDPLLSSLQDRSASVREKAIWALGKIADERAVDALIAALDDTDEGVSWAASEVLDNLGWVPVQAVAGEEFMQRGEEEAYREAFEGEGEAVIEERPVVESEAEAAPASSEEPFEEAFEEEPELVAEPPMEVVPPEVVEEIAGEAEKEAPEAEEVPEFRMPEAVRVSAVAEEELVEVVSPEIVEELLEAAEEEALEGAAAEAGGPGPEVSVEALEAGAEQAEAEIEPLKVPIEVFPATTAEEQEPAIELEMAEAAPEAPVAQPEAAVDESEKAARLVAARQWNELIRMGEAAVDPLIEALHDEDASVRRKAAWILSEIGEAAVEPLLLALEDPREDVRELASDVLDRLGWEVGDEAEKARRLIAEKQWDRVAKIGSPAVNPLIHSLKQGDEETRRQSAVLLGLIADDKALEPLALALNDHDSEVRRKAVWALGKIDGEKAVDALAQALRDEDSDVRFKSAALLYKLGWKPSGDEERALCYIANRQWMKLIELGEPSLGPLSKRLEDSDPEVREQAEWITAEIKSAVELERLMRGLREEA